jgi:hypothetical protein
MVQIKILEHVGADLGFGQLTRTILFIVIVGE